MNNLDEKLRAALYRVDCPDSLILGEYHLGEMPASARATITEHLAICLHCRQEIAQLETFLVEASLPEESKDHLAGQVKVWIAKLLTPHNAGTPNAIPALAIRGDEDTPLIYEAGAGQLTLTVQDDPAAKTRKSLFGLVIGLQVAEATVCLWQDGRQVQQTPVDVLGNFVLAGVNAGNYDLILSTPNSEIHILDLNLD